MVSDPCLYTAEFYRSTIPTHVTEASFSEVHYLENGSDK